MRLFVGVHVGPEVADAFAADSEELRSRASTLAGLTAGVEPRSRALLEGLTERALGTTRVEAITLFESRLSPKGPSYVPLVETRLRAA